MRAIALDNDRPALDVIDAFCDRIDSVDLLKTFTRTDEARQYLDAHPVDLIFLETNLARESGLSFFRSISQPTLVIFTTAYSDYAVESYEVDAVDYLLKPFSFRRFEEAIQRAQRRRLLLRHPARSVLASVGSESTHLYFRVDLRLVKVTLSDILFIRGLDNYLRIHVHDSPSSVVRLTLKAMLEKLPVDNFVRVHRSYIVALDKIQATRQGIIQIGNQEIPIGNHYEKDFFRLFRS